MVDVSVQEEIKISMRNAIQHFRNNGLTISEAPVGSLQNLTECSLAQLFTMKDVPLILRDASTPKKSYSVYNEILKSMFGKSKFSFAGLFFNFLYDTNGLLPVSKTEKYVQELEDYRQKFLVSLKNKMLEIQTY